MPELDATSTHILAFIRRYTAQHGVPPYVSEICAAVGSYRGTVYARLRLLRLYGLLSHLPGQRRRCWTMPDYTPSTSALFEHKPQSIIDNRHKQARWLAMIAAGNAVAVVP